MKIKIGAAELDNNIFLAPMAGVTDQPFRILCKEQGCGLVYTEMVSAKGMFYNNENTKNLLRISESERPAAVQIFGREPELMAAMAASLPAEIIDINMGCPAPKIVKTGEGSALMKEPLLVGRIVSAVSGATDKPVTVKIRKGFDSASCNAVEIARIAQESGAAAVTVHGRTREQHYSGRADWEIIASVRAALSIPVIGNGDVIDEYTAERMLRETGVAAVMIGRAAQGDPWIFSRINHYLSTGSMQQQQPSAEEKIATALRHGRMLIEYKGEYIGVREMRKQLAWYLKGMEHASRLRLEINSATSFSELESILGGIIAGV